VISKILLAAFKCLGAKEENTSERLCRVLAVERHGLVDYVVFDLGPNVLDQLERALSSEPGGILLVHENGSLRWCHLQIEDCAFNIEQPLKSKVEGLEFTPDIAEMPYLQKLDSDFALAARAAIGGKGLIEMIADLSAMRRPAAFWCGRAYYRALEWSQSRKKSALLVHVGIPGAEETKLVPLRRILDLFIGKVSHENRC
jgi:hypothetical protein